MNGFFLLFFMPAPKTITEDRIERKKKARCKKQHTSSCRDQILRIIIAADLQSDGISNRGITTKMVTDVYSHILDEDRVKTAHMIEDAFYGSGNGNDSGKNRQAKKMIPVPEGMDADQVAKALESPEMQAVLAAYIHSQSSGGSDQKET